MSLKLSHSQKEVFNNLKEGGRVYHSKNQGTCWHYRINGNHRQVDSTVIDSLVNLGLAVTVRINHDMSALDLSDWAKSDPTCVSERGYVK